MDKVEHLKKILLNFYPDVNFIVRINKQGFYNIIIKGVKYIEYDETLMERVFTFVKSNPIVINSFIDSISSFHPDFNRGNTVVKYIMNNGKVNLVL
jgi:hypothetical protein